MRSHYQMIVPKPLTVSYSAVEFTGVHTHCTPITNNSLFYIHSGLFLALKLVKLSVSKRILPNKGIKLHKSGNICIVICCFVPSSIFDS